MAIVLVNQLQQQTENTNILSYDVIRKGICPFWKDFLHYCVIKLV